MPHPQSKDYPRMMFSPHGWVIVNSEDEEMALGPEWSRKIFAAQSPDEKPPVIPDPEPEAEPEEETEEELEPEEVYAHPADAQIAPPARPKRAKPAAHKPPHKAVAHKRKG